MLMDSISKKSPKRCALYYLQLGPPLGYRQQTVVQQKKLSTVYPSQFACYAKFLVTRHALPANILLRDGAKQCLQRKREVSGFT